jgi:ABC-type antimicrobial peptide transport system ATPase subunit
VLCRHLRPLFVLCCSPFTLVHQLTHEHALCIVVVTARQRLIEEVRSSRAVIIVGETGSGKTTRMLAPTLSPFSVVVDDLILLMDLYRVVCVCVCVCV